VSRASQILAGDPAMVLKARQAALEDAPPPPEGREYEHGTECRSRGSGPPAWELVDEDAALWRRRCMQLGCGVTQYWHPEIPPSPPRPDEAALSGWSHAFDGKPCVNVEPAIGIELVPFEDESQRRRGLQYWRGECRVCKSVKRWVLQAAAHYREHDVELTADRPRTFRLDQVTGPSPDEQAEHDREAFRRGLRGER
jgi:hypothetical protein